MESQEDNVGANSNGAKSRSPVEVMRQYIESLPEEVSIKEEIMNFQFWKAVRTEFLAAMFYVLFGCSSCLNYSSLPPKLVSNSTNDRIFITQNEEHVSLEGHETVLLELKVSLMFGMTAATLIQCMGQVSGCHLTPAITISLLVTRRLTILRCVLYIFVQCFGSIVGSGILYGLLTTEQRSYSGLGLTVPAQHLNASQAFGYEFLGTFIVVLAFLVNADPQRTDAGFKSLSIGFAYFVAHIFAFRHTGASLSPARSFGPAVIKGIWHYHWVSYFPFMSVISQLALLHQVYWVAPLISGMLSGFTYEYIRSTSSNECQTLKGSFRRRAAQGVKRDQSSNLSNYETEFTITSTECPRY